MDPKEDAGEGRLTTWHRMGYLVRLMPPANTVKVRAACRQKFRSVCLPLRLIRMALGKHRCVVRNLPLSREGVSPSPASVHVGTGETSGQRDTPQGPDQGKDGQTVRSPPSACGWWGSVLNALEHEAWKCF